MKITKLGDTYLFEEGAILFKFTPTSGRAECSANWLNKGFMIQYLAQRGYEIDFSHRVNNFGDKGGTIYFTLNTDIYNEEDALTLLEMEDLRKVQPMQKEQDLLAQNWDNRQNKSLKWTSINNYLSTFKKEDRSRQDLCDYVNSFNIETTRKGSPVFSYSTQSKDVLVDMARNLMKKMYDSGELIRYTEEETQAKLNKLQQEEQQ